MSADGIGRALGRTGVRVTGLGFGGAGIGNLYREVDDDEASAALDVARDAGVRYLDTAPHYGLGLSERRIGAWLAGQHRDDYVISTKVGRRLVPNGAVADDDRVDHAGEFVLPEATHQRVWDFSAAGVLQSLEQSLERLGTDQIDVALLHDPDDHWRPAVEEALPALVDLRDQGVVGAIGVGMNQSAMLTWFVQETDVDLVMVAGRYTLLDQGALTDLLPAAEARGVSVVAAGVFNSGLLATPRPDPGARYDYAAAPGEIVTRAERIAQVCERHGTDLPTAAVHFPLTHPSVASVVVGVQDADQMRANADRFAAGVPDGLWDDLVEDGLLDPAVRGPMS